MPSSPRERWLPPALAARGAAAHVVVALSGGVDSAVAALRLRAAGVGCSALFMKNWNEADPGAPCPWETDVADALQVCETLGLALNAVDLSAAYWSQVFEDFLAGYRAGRTPNPDVLCNREIKFRAFLDLATAAGADCIATGHYVRRDEVEGRYRLLCGRDPTKDQSYFLYMLDQAQLARALFPIGELTKPQVRAAARAAGLAPHAKPDSTGICFIGEQPFRQFLARYIAARPGPVVDLAGRQIGEHHGAVYYTLGQRQGLGIGGVRKDLERNVLVAVQGHDHPALLSTRLVASQLTWTAGTPPAPGLRLSARTRYRQPLQACTLEITAPDHAEVNFATPQRAVTPGQSVVLYADEECLGGGIIEGTA